MDAAVADAIAAKKIPGGVLWFERAGEALPTRLRAARLGACPRADQRQTPL